MNRLRETFDADRAQTVGDATQIKTGENQYPASCGSCGAAYFVDKARFEQITRAAAAGLDNPFMCDDCEREYEELTYES